MTFRTRAARLRQVSSFSSATIDSIARDTLMRVGRASVIAPAEEGRPSPISRLFCLIAAKNCGTGRWLQSHTFVSVTGVVWCSDASRERAGKKVERLQRDKETDRCFGGVGIS